MLTMHWTRNTEGRLTAALHLAAKGGAA